MKPGWRPKCCYTGISLDGASRNRTDDLPGAIPIRGRIPRREVHHLLVELSRFAFVRLRVGWSPLTGS